MTNASARRAELEEAVAAAKAEQREVSQQAQEAHRRVAQLREQLAARPIDEYADDGQAKPKTTAAKLYRDLQAAENPPVPWPRRAQDAAAKVTQAKRAVDDFTAGNIVELVKELEPEAHGIDSEIVATINRLDELIVSRTRFEQKLAGLLAPVRGLDAASELPHTDHLVQLRRTLRNTELRPPLPRSICPAEGTLPPKVETRDGWITRAHAEVTAEQKRRRREEQEQREAKARRRIPISPNQPGPSLHAEAELMRRGWEPR
jgi:hypothetical protein